MSKHTPGPWTVGDLDRNGQRIVRQEHIEIATCWHHCVGSIEKQMEANARLIAAAPDLLEALQMIYSETADYIRLNNLGGMDNQCMQLSRAAIAKATGEGA